MNIFDDFYQPAGSRKPGILLSFLFLCAGADRKLLAQCPTEWTKYACSGAAILITGLLAVLTGGYALYTVFINEPNALAIAICFGAFWGFTIFNIDRFIFSTIRKEGKPLKEFGQAIPRFILAIAISLVISKPLELKIFESRITRQIYDQKMNTSRADQQAIEASTKQKETDEQLEAAKDEIEKNDSLRESAPNSSEYQEIKKQKEKAETDRDRFTRENSAEIQKAIAQARAIRANPRYVYTEPDGNGGTRRLLTRQGNALIVTLNNKIKQLKSEIKEKEDAVKDLEDQLDREVQDHRDRIDQKLATYKNDTANLRKQKELAAAKAKELVAASDTVNQQSFNNTLISRLDAMGELTKKDDTMWWISKMIMMLIIIIEITPIANKLMMKKGPYDMKLEAIEQIHDLIEREKISRWNSNILKQLEVTAQTSAMHADTFKKTEEEKAGKTLAVNMEVLEYLATMQRYVAKLRARKWFRNLLQNESGKMPGKFEETTWRLQGTSETVDYLFKNGKPKDNQLLLVKKDQVSIGTWSWANADKNEISVQLEGNDISYSIEELAENFLRLKEKGGKHELELLKL